MDKPRRLLGLPCNAGLHDQCHIRWCECDCHEPEPTSDSNLPIFASGGNRRAQRRKFARWEKQATVAPAQCLSPTAPGYRVVPIREDDASVSPRGARVRLEYRPPKRRRPESERPSRVKKTRS
jgi:hypothetical protein